MPTLLEILNDPNYVNANPATKEAIFNKYAVQDENYTGANEATQAAIKQRFGLGRVQAPEAEPEEATPTTAKAAQPTEPPSERGLGTVASDYGKIIGAELVRLGSVPEAAVESGLGLIGDIYAPKPGERVPLDQVQDPEAYLYEGGRASEEEEQAKYYQRRRTADEAIKYVKDTLVPDFVYDMSKGATEKSKAIRENISPELQEKIKGAEIKGNLLEAIKTRDFSKLSFGDKPTAEGYVAQGVQVLGSLIPVIATAIATKNPMAAGAVGGTMAASEAVDTAKQYIAGKTDDELIEASPYYAQMRNEGISEKDAREAITANAAGTAAYMQGLVATFGGAFTGKLVSGTFKPLSQVSKNRLVRIATGTAIGAAEEGTQEFLEGIASDYGIDRSVIKEIGEDSFANLILGSLGGGPVGAIGGARTPQSKEQKAADEQRRGALERLRQDALNKQAEADKEAAKAQEKKDVSATTTAEQTKADAEQDLDAINQELDAINTRQEVVDETSAADKVAAQTEGEQRVATDDEFNEIVGKLSVSLGREPTTDELEAAINEFERDPRATVDSVVGGVKPSLSVPAGGIEAPTGVVQPVGAGLGSDSDLFTGTTEGTGEVDTALKAGVAPVSGFKTAKGSTYTVDEQGKTARTKKSAGRGQGETYAPHSVLYVSEADSKRIIEDKQAGSFEEGSASIQLGYIAGNSFKPVFDISQMPEDAEPLVAVVDKNKNMVTSMYKAQRTPAVGLSPVEKLYQEDGTSNTHVGNPIVELFTKEAAPTVAQTLAPTDIPTYSREKHQTPLDDVTDEYNDAITKYDRYVDRGEAVPEDVQKRAAAAREKAERVFLEQPEVVSYNGRYYINPARFQWKLNEDGTADDDSARQQFGAYVQANLDAGNKVSIEEEVYEEDADEPTYKKVEITQLSPDGRSYLNPNYDPNKPTTRFENSEYIPFPTSYSGPEGRGNSFEIEGAPVTLGAPTPKVTRPKPANIDMSGSRTLGQIKEEKAYQVRLSLLQARAALRRIIKRFAEGRTSRDDQNYAANLLERIRDERDQLRNLKTKKDTPEDFLRNAANSLAAGRISPEVYSFINLIYEKLPEILNGIRLRSGKYSAEQWAASELGGAPLASGTYDPLYRIIKLYQETSGAGDPRTLRHEIVHTLEQMMSPEAAQDVVKSWENAFKAKMNATKGNAKAQEYFKKVMDYLTNPTEANKQAAINALPSYDYYQYLTPSEYWAVNAEPLLLANLGSNWQKFKSSVRALFEALKDVFGFDNRSAIHKAFKEVMRGSKERSVTGKMLEEYVTGAPSTTLADVQEPRQTPGGIRVAQTSGSKRPTLAQVKNVFSWRAIKDLTGGARRNLFKIYNLRWLSEEVGSRLPQFRAAIRMIDQMSGMTQDIISEGEVGVQKIISALRKKNGTADVELLGEICVESTIRQIDPDKNKTDLFLNEAWEALSEDAKQAYRFMRDFYSRQVDGLIQDLIENATSRVTDADKKQAIRDAIETEFRTAKTMKPYFPLRRFGNFWFQVGLDTDKDKEFYAFESESERDHWYKERVKEMQASGDIRGTDIGNQFLKDQVFQTDPAFDVLRRLEKIVDESIPSTTAKGATEIANDLKDSLNQLSYLLMPSNNFRKMFINRKGIQGANSDILRVFSGSVMNIAQQRAKVKYASQYRQNLANAAMQLRNLPPTKDKLVLGELVSELERRTPHILGEDKNSPMKWLSNGVTQLAFIWYLTAPATALINNLGLIAVGIPTAGKRFGMRRISNYVTRYSGRVLRTTYRQVVTKDSSGEIQIKMQAPDLGVDLEPNKRLRLRRQDLMRQGSKEGVALTRQQIDDILLNEYAEELASDYDLTQEAFERLVGEYEDALYGFRELSKNFEASQIHDMAMLSKKPLHSYTNGWQRMVRALAAAFHNSEKFNREVLGMAVYDAALEDALKKGMPKEEARNEAIQQAQEMIAQGLGEFTKASNAPLFSNPGAQVLLQFKKYSLLMTYNMYKDIKTMLNLDNSMDIDLYRQQRMSDGVQGQQLEADVAAFKQEVNKFKREAFKRFWGTQGATFLIGGSKATIFWWPITLMIEFGSMGLAAATGDDDDIVEDGSAWLTEQIAEYAYGGEATAKLMTRGPLSAVANLSITERVSLNLPDLWVRDSSNKRTAEAELVDKVAENMGPAFAMARSWVRAYDLLKEGQNTRALEASVPAVAKNGIMVYRYMNEGVRTKTGEEIKSVEDLTTGDLFARALGFSPDDVFLAQKALIKRKGIQQDIEQKRERLLGRMYQSLLFSDYEEMDKVLEQMSEFNTQYPEAAISQENIRDSMRSREKRRIENETFGGVKPKYEMRADDVIKMPRK